MPGQEEQATLTAVEREAQELLQSWDAGDIDNVFDIVNELFEINERLPKDSKLREAFDAMYAACEQIMIDNS